MPTPDQLEAALDLVRHPEGGAFVEIYRSATQHASRSLGTAIHFMLRAGEHSTWHTVTSDELWLFQGGDPLDLHVGDAVIRLGLDVAAGQRPSALVPAHAWQAAVPCADGPQGFTLIACLVVPGFDFADFHLADATEMATLPSLSANPL